jgi:two-component system NtrC family sensor kinase
LPARPAHLRQANFARYLALGVLCINLIVVAAAMFHLHGERVNDEEKARLLGENLVLLVVQDIEHEYDKIDQSLRSIAEEHADYATRGAAELSAWLTRMQGRNAALSLLRITDAEGQATPARDRDDVPPMNIADRPYFARLRDDAQAGLQISPPLLGRSSGKTVIILARRLEDLGGRFVGVAVASIAVDYVQDKFARLNLGPLDVIGLRAPDLSWIQRRPPLPEPMLPGSSTITERFHRMLEANPDRGVFNTGPDSVDGVEGMYAYRRSPRYGFYVTAGLASEGYLSDWQRAMQAAAALLGLFALLSGGLALLLHRTWTRQTALTAELRERNEWISEAERVGGFGHFTIDPIADRWTASTSLREIAGVGSDPPKTWADWLAVVHPADRDRVDAAFHDALSSRQQQIIHEYRIVRPVDGAVRWLSGAWRLAPEAAGGLPQVLGTIHDVTARRAAEDALRHSELLFRSLFENSIIGMATTSPERQWIEVNQATCDILGYSRAELLNKNWMELTHPDDRERNLSGFDRILAGEIDAYELEKRYIRKDGAVIDAYIAARVVRRRDGAIDYFITLIQDITARKNAERELHRSRDLLQRFLDHLPGTAYIKDATLRVVHANRRFLDLLNLDPRQLIGRSNREIFPGELDEQISADDRRVLASGQTEVLDEHHGGAIYETTRFVIPQDDGAALLGGISLDITRRRQLEARTRALLEINEVGGSLPEREFLAHGLELAESLTGSRIGFLHFVNDDQESIELVTWTAGALQGCTAAFDSHYPISQAGIWADCFRRKQPVTFNHYRDYADKHGLPEGHTALHRLISVPVIEESAVRMMIGVGNKADDYHDVDLTTVQLIGNDLWRIVRRARAEAALARRLAEVTQLKERLEQAHLQLLQSEKMSAIGQLAAGVAHELNNPIGFVYSNLGTLQKYVDDLLAIEAAHVRVEQSPPSHSAAAREETRHLKAACDYEYIIDDLPKLIRESKEGLERVRRIVLDLKDFSRSGESDWQWTDLHTCLDSTINIAWNELKYKAEVERQYAVLPQVRCLPSQLNQVFMNLLVNAAQAIERRGRIVIRTASHADGQSVWVEIEDNGRGLSPAVQKRLFEPFFTTKPVGQGTGLGLSISFNIIEKHHGRIEVRSEPGHGTTFRITLPVDGSPRKEAKA